MGLSRHAGVRLVALSIAALAVPAHVYGQASVASAQLTATVDMNGTASVTVAYQLTGAPEAVGLEILEFGSNVASDVIVAGQREIIWPTVGTARQATIELDPGQRAGFELSYTVDGTLEIDGAEFHIRLPIVTVDLPPSGGDVFSAAVSLPDGWEILDGFPTGIAAGEGTVDLQVVPSLVSARGPISGMWDPIRLPLVAQLLTLTILTVAAAAGWWHLRSLGR